MTIIGKRSPSGPGDDEGFERVPDEEFEQLPEDYGEWDDEDRAYGGNGRICIISVYDKPHPDAEDYRFAEELLRYHESKPQPRRPDIIGRRPYEGKPLKRPKGLLAEPGDEDYCPFEDAERHGMSIEDFQEHSRRMYAYEPEALRDINDKIARGLATEKQAKDEG